MQRLPQGGDLFADPGRRTRALQRLARSLLEDPAAADDVVQEAWLAAIRKPPRGVRDVQAWLAGVARNRALKERRSRARQAARERRAARPEAVEERPELLDREEFRGRLEASVEAVGEPYASVLRMRYWEEASVAEIAARLERPEGTVKVQIKRGLERLRQRLDREHGEPLYWELGAIAAFDWELADLPAGPIAGGGAAALLSPWRTPALVVLALMGGLIVLRALSDPPPVDPAAGTARAPEPHEAGAATPGGEAAEAPASSTGTPGERTALTPDAGSLEAQVLVRDATGRPVPGAGVYQLVPGGERLAGRTDGEGRVRFEPRADDLVPLDWAPAGRYLALYALAEGRAASPVVAQLAGEPAGPIELSIGEQGLTVLGRVVDPAGRPIEAATATLLGRLVDSWERSQGEGRRYLRTVPLAATTDATGRFELSHLPRRELMLCVGKPGWANAWVQVAGELRALHEERVVLVPGHAIRGVVRDAARDPVAGARVHFGLEPEPQEISVVTSSDEEGRYELRDLAPGRQHVWARAPDGRLAREKAVVNPGPESDLMVDLVVRATSTLRARLVDAEGRPLVGAPFLFQLPWTVGESAIVRITRQWLYQRTFSDEDGFVSFEVVSADDLEGRPAIGLALAQEGEQIFPVGWTRWERADEEVHEVRCEVRPDEWGTIRGRLLDHEGLALPRTTVQAIHGGMLSATVSVCEAVSGEYQIPDVPPATYRLVAQVEGRGVLDLGEHALAPGEVLELGTIRAPAPGFALPDWDPELEEAEAVRYQFLQDVRIPGLPSPLVPVRLGQGPDAEPLELFPGKYGLIFFSDSGALPAQWFRVRSGRDHWLPIGADAPRLATFEARGGSTGKGVFLVYSLPAELDVPDGALSATGRQRVAAAARLAADFEEHAEEDGVLRCEHCLEPGRWALLVEDGAGRSAGVAFTLRPVANVFVDLDLALD